MNRIFEPLELDLGDARLLPNRVIEVQEKVEELLSARTNLHRREALVEDLCSHKAWVLPGLINATMVFADQLDIGKNLNELARILSTVAKDNPAAINLLLKSGIYQNPFYKSRAVIVEALRQLKWQPDDVKPIKNLLKILKDDDVWVLDLYRLYLRLKSENAYREGINLCEEWFRIPKDVAKDLFRELLINYPEKAGDIISRVFLAVTEISEVARKEKEYSTKVIGCIPPEIAIKIVKEGVLTEISKDVLEDMYVPRHKAIENLWEYSIKELSNNNPQFEELDLIANNIIEQCDLCSSQVRESIYRYWMQGLGSAGLIEYLITQIEKDDDEVYQLQAVIQLFFRQKDKRAKQVLSDLERDNFSLYSKAQENFETIITYKNTNVKHIQERQAKKGPDLSEK